MYCGDKGIEDGLIMSVTSLLENVRSPLNIYILTAGCTHKGKTFTPLPQETVRALNALAKEYSQNNSVSLIDCTELFADTPLSANLGTRFTPMCMLRLFADKIDAIPQKILYLDYDVICRKDISQLYDTNVEKYEFAGVLDRYGKWFYRKSLFAFDYVNSGVLLLNMKEIRHTGLFTACRKMCAEKKMLLPDQSAINKLAKRKLLLPDIYNEQRAEKSDTVLRHFSTFFTVFPKFKAVTVKPWHKEKMHSILNNYEYDSLLDKCEYFKKKHIKHIETGKKGD